jgi:eukaryotic-like serine/threonine-protein kinase
MPDELIADRYETLEALGAGAFGDVYKVFDRQDEEVRALKLLRAGTGSLAVLARFEREFAAISRIVHPNIIRVYDFGMHGEHPYFSMEFLEGTDLRTFQETRRPPLGQGDYASYATRVAYIFHQVCDGLSAVHGHDVVHRDIKPENILVGRGKFPRAKLLDFGHAREDDGQDLTKTGTVMGTALYIAPEQAMAGDITPQADLYAVGCVLYETLTGAPPFGGKNVIDVLMGHIRQPPPDARETEPRIQAELADLVIHMLQKTPEDRPEGADAVAEILGRL